MQAQSARTGLPVFAGGVIGKPGIEPPLDTPVVANPQARWIYARVERFWLIQATWLDRPGILDLLTAFRRKFNSLLRFMPCLPKIVAIVYERAEEISVSRRKQPLSTTLIE